MRDQFRVHIVCVQFAANTQKRAKGALSVRGNENHTNPCRSGSGGCTKPNPFGSQSFDVVRAVFVFRDFPGVRRTSAELCHSNDGIRTRPPGFRVDDMRVNFGNQVFLLCLINQKHSAFFVSQLG